MDYVGHHAVSRCLRFTGDTLGVERQWPLHLHGRHGQAALSVGRHHLRVARPTQGEKTLRRSMCAWGCTIGEAGLERGGVTVGE
eukprot:5269667-Pleurochrysis_carterae.AAC.1